MKFFTQKTGGKYSSTKDDIALAIINNTLNEINVSTVDEDMSLKESLKLIKAEAKKKKRQALQEAKEERKLEKEKRRVYEVSIEVCGYEEDKKRFRTIINGEERFFYSMSELKRAVKKEYRIIGKIRKPKKATSLLPIVVFGAILAGAGDFLVSISEGPITYEAYANAVFNWLYTIIFAFVFTIPCMTMASIAKGKIVIIPRGEPLDECRKVKKMSRASITASFFVFSILTTIITEATKTAYSAIQKSFTDADLFVPSEYIGWILVTGGFAMIFLAYCMPSIVRFLTWISGFIKFFGPAEENEEQKP